jgi:transposase
MRLDELYPLKGFTLTQIVKTHSGRVLLKAVSSSRSALCPYCQTLSQKRHSVYIREPQALPCSDTSIQLILRVQRYFCQNPACNHTTFAERIPETAHFYSRRTIHLEALLKILAFEMSAETAARVCDKLKVQASPDCLLRLIRKTDPLSAQTVRVLGVDDWAVRTGQNYGTILVDLEKHRAIDLLPDRTQNTLSIWLQKHPEIEIISRDRSFEYKTGIDRGAPQAVQVVDRWHLLHNLQEKLQEIIPSQLKRQKSDAEKKETPSSQKRKKHFELVNYLHAKGYSQRLIGRLLGISRGTVRRYLENTELPNWQPRKPSASKLDIYRDYLHTRWKDGCQDVSLLWKELQQKGYKGQRKSVAEYLQRFRTQSPFRSARQRAWLFMKDADRLQEEERNHLKALFVENPKLQEIYWLAQSFRGLLSQQSPEKLDDWLIQMEHCGVKKLQNFATGLRQDYEAVKAALSYEWSNGQVEGQVNRLKAIKHQMYGRANFDLLLHKILGPPK